MVPTLAPGDYLIADRRAYRARVPRVGDIVLARDPREAARTLVKRVAAADGGRVDLRGDNAGQSTDSRAFGRVEPGAVIGRVRWRYWPHPGRVR
ncbi:MAG: nickel-type superoxide dismutase maturation protease [Chloroflexi bacterium]|nr:nickel-type superoxide dismutase maturation protease [Chloroflexota bacterium]